MSARPDPNSKFEPAPKTRMDGSQMNFKQQLDQAAHDAREPDEPPQQNPIVEKVTQHIPAASKILGGTAQESKDAGDKISRPGIPGPPERPYDDAQVEEFIRQQHRSKGESGLLE